jgi:hypothetical protein
MSQTTFCVNNHTRERSARPRVAGIALDWCTTAGNLGLVALGALRGDNKRLKTKHLQAFTRPKISPRAVYVCKEFDVVKPKHSVASSTLYSPDPVTASVNWSYLVLAITAFCWLFEPLC